MIDDVFKRGGGNNCSGNNKDHTGHPGRKELTGTFTCCPELPCCGHYPVPLTPAEAVRLQVDPSYWIRGRRVLARKPDGQCLYLTAEGCGIRADRPAACLVRAGAGDEKTAL